MNRRQIQIGAISALAAVMLGVAGTTAQAATHDHRTATVRSSVEPTSDRAFLAYLNSPEGRPLLKASGITQADLAAASNGDANSKGIFSSLKKKALEAAWKTVPSKWRESLEKAAKNGKAAFKKAFNKLPKSVKKILTVGGTIALQDVLDWLYDIIV